MQKRSRQYRIFRWGSLVFLLAGLVLVAPAARPAQAADEASGWVITSLTTAEPEICIGQKVSVFGEYNYVTSSSNPLTPLTGPDKIITHAIKGNTGPQNLYSGTPSGSFEFEYEGVKDGQDTITAEIIASGQSTGSKSVPINVTKTCVYSYSLVATMDSSKQGGGASIAFKNVITAQGKLTVDISGNRTHLTSNRRIEATTTLTQFSVPDCENATTQPGYAAGSVLAEADLSSQRLVMLKINAPKNFDWIYQDQGACDGHSIQVGKTFDLSQLTKNAPDWIEQDFLPDGGTVNLKLDMFEQALDNCQKGGMSCSYTATLKLTRQKGE